MFKRISENRLPEGCSLEQVFDEIRMRDAEGHPLTYINYGNLRIEFNRASLRRYSVEANVKICLRES